MSDQNTQPRYGRNARNARNAQKPARKPQGPEIKTVAIGQVEVASWFLCVCRVAPAARKQARESLTEWALSSQMSSSALVEEAYAMAREDRRFGELQGEMTRRGNEAYELEAKIQKAGDQATDELKAEFEAAKAKHETAGGNKRGAVLKMTDEQFDVVKRWGRVLFGEPTGDAEKRTLGALIGKGRMHIRTTVELLKRFLVAEDLEKFQAEYEAAGQTQPATDDSAVADLPAPAKPSAEQPAAERVA